MCQIDSQYMLSSNLSCFCVLVAVIRVFTASTLEEAPVPLNCDRFARSSCFFVAARTLFADPFQLSNSTFGTRPSKNRKGRSGTGFTLFTGTESEVWHVRCALCTYPELEEGGHDVTS